MARLDFRKKPEKTTLDIKVLADSQAKKALVKQKQDDRRALRLSTIGTKALTEDVADILFDAISEGLSEPTACAMAGIHPSKYNEWMRKGEADVNLETVYGSFFILMLTAQGALEKILLTKVKEAKDWKAQIRILESALPHQYAKVQNVNVTQRDVTKEEQSMISKLDEAQLMRILSGEALDSVLTQSQLMDAQDAEFTEVN